jgi:hypothetical protein
MTAADGPHAHNAPNGWRRGGRGGGGKKEAWRLVFWQAYDENMVVQKEKRLRLLSCQVFVEAVPGPTDLPPDQTFGEKQTLQSFQGLSDLSGLSAGDIT